MIARVRAIIIVVGSILLIHRIKGGREYWVFPGGGVEEYDQSPIHALQRECLEEIGVEVLVAIFLLMRLGKREHNNFTIAKFYPEKLERGMVRNFNPVGNTVEYMNFNGYLLQNWKIMT